MSERNPFLTETGTLVNADLARIDPRKLTDYSLNPDHDDGGDKALVFERVLGYNRGNADDLSKVILAGIQTTPAQPGLINQDGVRFAVDLMIRGPTGRQATVRTAWIYRPGESIPRLTTAFIRRGGTRAQATTL